MRAAQTSEISYSIKIKCFLQAKTSALFEKESGMFGPMTQPGKPVYGLEHSNEGLITFPGGVDLRFEGFCE